mmetsp:Transcript_14402/g.30704  ORF Transcript_14402/g.30704 Transcript_14402/m.30704 type:complete len:187 (+) Transcript_14402:116-676(+)
MQKSKRTATNYLNRHCRSNSCREIHQPSSTQGNNNHNMAQVDFEESLVQAVLEENPPEERGIRDEWKEHVGWHRKENIFLRGGGGGDSVAEKKRKMQHEIASDSKIQEPNIIINEDEMDKHHDNNKEHESKNASTNVSLLDTMKAWKILILSVGITCFCLFRVFFWKRKTITWREQSRRIGKRRTT